MDLQKLRQGVEQEIHSYTYEWVDGLVGRPWGEEKVRAHLAAMRAALVEPYAAKLIRRDTFSDIGQPRPETECFVVADDAQGMVLAYDPVRNDYVLAVRSGSTLESFGVYGDAVGCFLAR